MQERVRFIERSEEYGGIMFPGEYDIDCNKDSDPAMLSCETRPHVEGGESGQMVVSMETRTLTSRQRSRYAVQRQQWSEGDKGISNLAVVASS